MAQILPNFSTSVKLKYVKLGYQYLVNHILTFLLIPIMLAVFLEILRLGPERSSSSGILSTSTSSRFFAPCFSSFSSPPSTSCPSLDPFISLITPVISPLSPVGSPSPRSWSIPG
ncbi:UNVERIFIED_CONTAM: 3-ketoacyl-CoA synthase 6 [Sesamum angustifolium]|uniref:3-ketoacyl-CoA synthase 6 n=1 Tax=Sesamum angustifolium TaxID=2727405 RepID=A0AAW2NIR3_9LAMI